MSSFEIKKDYKDNEVLRKSFNNLAEKSFGLNFEQWYQNGFWTQKYNPYSIVIDNKVISNISVNKMNFEIDGIVKNYIQIGTVMTDKHYRNKGLTTILMNQIEKDFAEVDGFYLFANDKVLDYYPKLDYIKSVEYQYSKIVCSSISKHDVVNMDTLKQIDMNDRNEWDSLRSGIEYSVSNSAFEMKGNAELIMFYTTQFMKENVYFLEIEKTYIVAEVKENVLFLYNVFSDKIVDIDVIVKSFSNSFEVTIEELILGFTPLNKDGYNVKILDNENSTLFVKGEDLFLFKDKQLMFSMLSHA